MRKQVSLAQVKATLSECVREVEGGEVMVITRHGRPVAALVPAHELDQLERLRQAGPEAGLASLAGGWEGSEDLVRLIEASARIGQRAGASLDEE